MKKNETTELHTFSVCTYGECPYLEECILSLFHQTMRSNIIIVTSTPNEYIRKIAEKYHVKLYCNPHQGQGIAQDWNFAYASAHTELITIVHQDDIYLPQYTEQIISHYKKDCNTLILFTDYAELRDKVQITQNRILYIKRIMLSPLLSSWMQKRIWIRRRILSLGNPICCPSVTYVRNRLPEVLFETGFQSNIDWQAYEKISRRKGSFNYCNQVLMCHRIHEESTTTEIIDNGRRKQEDLEMLQKFWPSSMARIVNHFYNAGEKSNKV